MCGQLQAASEAIGLRADAADAPYPLRDKERQVGFSLPGTGFSLGRPTSHLGTGAGGHFSYRGPRSLISALPLEFRFD